MKAEAKYYKGIEFINVSELPADQQLLLQHTRTPLRIKILADGKTLPNCIQYKDYGDWYTNVFERSVAHAKLAPRRNEVLPLKIEFGKLNFR